MTCEGSITVLDNVKIIKMTNQITEGGIYCSQKPNANSSTTLQFLTGKECEIRCKLLNISYLTVIPIISSDGKWPTFLSNFSI